MGRCRYIVVLFCSLAVLDRRFYHTVDVLSPFISILVARVPKITWIRSSFWIQYRCVIGRQKNTEPQHIPLYSSASRRKNMDGDRSSGNGVQTTSEGLVSPNMIIKRSGLTVLADRWKTRTIRKCVGALVGNVRCAGSVPGKSVAPESFSGIGRYASIASVSLIAGTRLGRDRAVGSRSVDRS